MIERKHLVAAEVGKLITAVKGSRNEARDRCLLLLMFRHGLRVSEACGLRLSQVDIESRVLHVLRLKKGLSTTHPLRTDEVRVIKGWLAERRRWNPPHDAFFVSERRTPLNRRTAWAAIRGYGEKAELALPAHPHMLRHACGFALADQGADTRLIQDYLGHRNIQHTVIYTAANPARFEKLWK
jgi:type 1 fimbriae regulatory protein FimB